MALAGARTNPETGRVVTTTTGEVVRLLGKFSAVAVRMAQQRPGRRYGMGVRRTRGGDSFNQLFFAPFPSEEVRFPTA